MTTDKLRPFFHRQNQGGTWDAICPDCDRTIATRRIEDDLEFIEQHHICDEVIGRLTRERQQEP
jgi:uncharacterized protein YcgI (DUF1989 family)